MISGTTLEGDPIAFGGDGLAVKKADGSFSDKVAWTNFPQAALKKLASVPRAKRFVEPLIEPDEPESAKKTAPEITLKPVPRLARPAPHAGFGAIFSSSLTVTLFFFLYLANIYAGYEIALFRNYPPAWVCSLAAGVPVIGPIIFLCLPTRIKAAVEEVDQAALGAEEIAATWQGGAEGAEAAAAEAAAAAPAAGGTAVKHPPPTVYKRGQTTFNRRFFETKLSGFLRVVPGDAEKDMVLCFRSSRGEHVGSRISRLTPNELFLQISKGNASNDVILPFGEIQEVIVRHKDV